MNKKIFFFYLRIFLTSILILGCSKDEPTNSSSDDLPFPWFEAGYKATLSYYNTYLDSASGTMTVNISKFDLPGLLQMQTITDVGGHYSEEIRTYKQTLDGIFEWWSTEEPTMDYLYLPYPVVKDYEFYRQTIFGSTIYCRILKVDEEVTLSIGEFETFVVRLNKQIDDYVKDYYYSIDDGIIKIEYLEKKYQSGEWVEDLNATPYKGYELVSND